MIQSKRALSESFSCRTAPIPDAPISFVAVSDGQLKPELPATAAAIGRLVKPDLIVFSGDLVNDPDRLSDWIGAPAGFLSVFTGRAASAPILQTIPLFPTLGNHEYSRAERAGPYLDESENLASYQALFTLPGNERYYGYDYGNTRFVHLNVVRQWRDRPHDNPRWPLADPIETGSPQYRWLARELAAYRDKWIVVSLHHPMFGRGVNASPPFCVPERDEKGSYRYPKDLLFEDLRGLLEDAAVDLVLWGHNHVYEHYLLKDVHYVEASSIGNAYGFRDKEAHGLNPVYGNAEDRSFLFVRANRTEMVVTAYKAVDGSVLESFTIPRKVRGDGTGAPPKDVPRQETGNEANDATRRDHKRPINLPTNPWDAHG